MRFWNGWVLFFKIGGAQFQRYRIEIMTNALEPGKAPFSHDYSALSLRWKAICELWLMGGSVQPQGHAQISMIIVDILE